MPRDELDKQLRRDLRDLKECYGDYSTRHMAAKYTREYMRIYRQYWADMAIIWIGAFLACLAGCKFVDWMLNS